MALGLRPVLGSQFTFQQDEWSFHVYNVQFGESCVLIDGAWMDPASRESEVVVLYFNLISQQWGEEEVLYDTETISVCRNNAFRKIFESNRSEQSVFDDITIIERPETNFSYFVSTYFDDGIIHARKRFKVDMDGWHLTDDSDSLPSILIIAEGGIVVHKQLNASQTKITSRFLPSIPNLAPATGNRTQTVKFSRSHICHMLREEDDERNVNSRTCQFWLYSRATREIRIFNMVVDFIDDLWLDLKLLCGSTLLIESVGKTLCFDLETLERTERSGKYAIQPNASSFFAPDENRIISVRRSAAEAQCEMFHLGYMEVPDLHYIALEKISSMLPIALRNDVTHQQCINSQELLKLIFGSC